MRLEFIEEVRGSLRFGRDPWERLVALHPDDANNGRYQQFAVEWPLRPSPDGVPDDAHPAADGAPFT
jgi:hypothetical protein